MFGGMLLAQERKSVREQIAEATAKMQARFDELEALFWTQWQSNEKRHTEAMEQIGQRLTALEGALAETRGAIDDAKRELTNDVTKRIGDLEVTYWGRRETDEQHHAEQAKEINDRLTTFERHVGDIKRELADCVTKRIDDLETTYWGHRETDQHHHAEQTKAITDKLTVFERQVDDVSHERKEVKRDLVRAADTTHQIHQMEMRLDSSFLIDAICSSSAGKTFATRTTMSFQRSNVRLLTS